MKLNITLRRIALVMALLCPLTLLLAKQRPLPTDFDSEFCSIYRGVKCGEERYYVARDSELELEPCSTGEMLIAEDALLNLDEDDPYWSSWCLGRRKWIDNMSFPRYWMKWIHPQNESKQIWIAFSRGAMHESGRVIAKARIGF